MKPEPGICDAAIAAAVKAERADVVAYAERFAGDVDGQVRKGKLSAAEGSMLKRRIGAFASGIEAGLHLEGGEA